MGGFCRLRCWPIETSAGATIGYIVHLERSLAVFCAPELYESNRSFSAPGFVIGAN